MSNDLWYTLHQLIRAFPLDCHMSESQRVALRVAKDTLRGGNFEHPPIPGQWYLEKLAPKNATEVKVKMFDGTVHEKAHWASDLSGESQPAFRGWFIPWDDGYTQIDTPEFWSPLK